MNIVPPWIIGTEKIPAWMPHLPDIIRDMRNLFTNNWKEEMRAISQWLTLDANREADIAVGNLKALHHISKKLGTNFSELEENLAGYVG